MQRFAIKLYMQAEQHYYSYVWVQMLFESLVLSKVAFITFTKSAA